MTEKDRNRDDVERKEAAVLPAREAMSIIAPGGGGASGSGEESMTSEDRDEHSERRDSASSQP